jgi:hypothetical protein
MADTYADRIQSYDLKISAQIEAYESLGDLLAECDQKVKKTTLTWCHNNPELSKKLGMERAEMAAAISEQEKCDYLEVCFLRLKAKIAERIMDASQAGLSGIQSMLKYSGGGR